MTVLQEIYLPKDSVSDDSAEVVELYVANGDEVKKGDMLLDIETSKAIVSIEAEIGGYIKLCCNKGQEVLVGDPLIKIVSTKDEALGEAGPFENKSKENLKAESEGSDTKFSRNAMALMKENNISFSEFSEMDFVTEGDVKELITSMSQEKTRLAQTSNVASNGLIDFVPVGKNKQTEIRYISEAQYEVLSSTLNVAVDFGDIGATLKSSFKIFDSSCLPLIIFEVSRLLKQFRVFNAFYVDKKIGYYKNINVGVATDIDDGLKVLTLYDADKLKMSEVETELYGLVEKYLDRELDVSEITNSTFTITDLSAKGVDFFTPLINSRQSAILGISQLDKKLNRFYLTLVFDHRVTEGRVAGEFLGELKNRLESYSQGNGEKQNENYDDDTSDIRCSICLKSLQEDRNLSGIGMIKIVDHSGKENHLCYICLTGY
jgi:pyruvate/2-oxoglutarate dehydrogenase complex dihydrolipoamide acyltransferase (E2) component